MAQYCLNCGAAMEDSARFCKECGTAVETTAAPPPAAPAPAPVTPPQASYSAPYAAPPQPVRPAPSYAPAQQAAWPPVGIGAYIGMMIVSGIPLIGFIMLLVWSFGSQVNPSKKNYARAVLILMLIGVALSILLWSVMIPIITDLIDTINSGFMY